MEIIVGYLFGVLNVCCVYLNEVILMNAHSIHLYDKKRKYPKLCDLSLCCLQEKAWVIR